MYVAVAPASMYVAVAPAARSAAGAAANAAADAAADAAAGAAAAAAAGAAADNAACAYSANGVGGAFCAAELVRCVRLLVQATGDPDPAAPLLARCHADDICDLLACDRSKAREELFAAGAAPALKLLARIALRDDDAVDCVGSSVLFLVHSVPDLGELLSSGIADILVGLAQRVALDSSTAASARRPIIDVAQAFVWIGSRREGRAALLKSGGARAIATLARLPAAGADALTAVSVAKAMAAAGSGGDIMPLADGFHKRQTPELGC